MSEQKQKKKKSGCLIAVGIVAALGIIGAAMGNNPDSVPTSSSSSTSSAVTSESSTTESSSSSEIESIVSSFEQSVSQSESDSNSDIELSSIPVVKGSNAYDITVSLKNNGLPDAERKETTDGFTFSATNSEYSYVIETDKNYALSYADYYVFGEDNGFLGFCASFPYDESDSQTIMDWVNANIGTEAETTIGDAEFILSVANTGPVLKVKAVGRDEYLENKLFGESTDAN